MMQSPDIPLVKEVVLIGGGHAHALLLRRWAMEPVLGTRITLINPDATAPYTGMLPGFVAGHYTRDQLEIDLVRLTRQAGARLVFGAATSIDPVLKTVTVAGRPPIPYDIASIDIGITSDLPDLPGFRDHGIGAKPLGAFADRWHIYLDESDVQPIAVIGGGIGGVELALAMHHRLAALGRRPEISIVEKNTLLASVSNGTRARLSRAVSEAGIKVFQHSLPIRASENSLELADGITIDAGLIVAAAGARPQAWLQQTDITLEGGFVAVDSTLRSVSHPTIYAVGDCAHLTHAPRPKAGVFAVRAAPVLTANIRAELLGNRHREFRPQGRYLKLVSLGEKSAVVDKYGVSPSGSWAWVWKDWIDRRFMDRLNEPVAPKVAPPPKNVAKDALPTRNQQVMCGGCGSKVGSGVLDRAIAALPFIVSNDVMVGPGDDAALIRCGGETLALTTDHLRVFWNDPWIMARIAAIHAMGDVWAMGGQPQALLAQIILPRMTERLQEVWLQEILDGALSAATESGASLAGGHTSQGAELTIGFTVTGRVSATPTTLGQARAGDTLILTKPIGTGTILAAEMLGKAQGGEVAHAIGLMSEVPTRALTAIRGKANAMTDVTGFGLAGHALKMAEAADLTIEISSANVPILPGAERLAAQGIGSTLAPANRASLGIALPDTPAGRLLIDPQTSGGFLASVPTEDAADIVVGIGPGAAIIGRVLPRGVAPLTIV